MAINWLALGFCFAALLVALRDGDWGWAVAQAALVMLNAICILWTNDVRGEAA